MAINQHKTSFSPLFMKKKKVQLFVINQLYFKKSVFNMKLKIFMTEYLI